MYFRLFPVRCWSKQEELCGWPSGAVSHASWQDRATLILNVVTNHIVHLGATSALLILDYCHTNLVYQSTTLPEADE